MPRKKASIPADEQNCYARRWSSRKRQSTSPTKSIPRTRPSPSKSRLPPSSPLSTTTSSTSQEAGTNLPAAVQAQLDSVPTPSRKRSRDATDSHNTSKARRRPTESTWTGSESSDLKRQYSTPSTSYSKAGESSQSALRSPSPTPCKEERPRHVSLTPPPWERAWSFEDESENPSTTRKKSSKEKKRPRCEAPDDFDPEFEIDWQADLERALRADPDPPEPVEIHVEPEKKKPAREPTKLPAQVDIGSTCLYWHKSSWFLAILRGFEPGPTLSTDRYIVQAKDVKDLKKAKRAEIHFLHEPKVKELKGLGGYKTTVDLDPLRFTSDAMTRSATPPPTGEEDLTTSFENLPRQIQLYRIRPHLDKIIRDEYAPARPRTDAFHHTRSFKYTTGDWDTDEISGTIEPEVRRYLLRPSETIPDQQPRPTGCDMYEALSETDKGKFITDIIIPEAIIQIEILARDNTPISTPITPEVERLQYRAAIKRLEKRRKEKNPWEVRHFQALQAMGKFNKEVDENEELRRKAEEGKTHRFSWGGAERIVKVVDYRGT